MVTRKEEKIPLPRSPPALQQRPNPSPTPPSPDVQRVQVGWAPTSVLRLRPHPGTKVKGEGFPSAIRPGTGPCCQSFGRGRGRRGSRGPRPPAPARPARRAALRAGPADRAHPVPAHLWWTWLRQREPRREGRREAAARGARGDSQPRARAPRPARASAGPRPGAATLTARGPLGGARLPRRALRGGAGGALSASEVGRASGVGCLPSRPEFLGMRMLLWLMAF